ncbi:DUF397 domain-containing protein [Streptomyces sp. NPDC087658]|uniref:DUF397 domain-containing protein n=1 Tax=Streptomyces sp. NPDC087658 TaxID=3365800 RepID=UPI00382C4803
MRRAPDGDAVHGDPGGDRRIYDGVPDVTPIRDSKQPRGPVLVFPANSWSVFVRTLKNDA